MRKLAEDGCLDADIINIIMHEDNKPPAFKLKLKVVAKYFKPEQKPDEIEAVITAALDYYYAHQAQEGLFKIGK